MSTFKEQIAKDNAVFFNPAEFGEMHLIDGKSVRCIIDENIDKQDTTDDYGRYVVMKHVFVCEGELAKMPVIGRSIIIDGDPYMCKNVSHEMGVLDILVELDNS
jgi:hypothetical protein